MDRVRAPTASLGRTCLNPPSLQSTVTAQYSGTIEAFDCEPDNACMRAAAPSLCPEWTPEFWRRRAVRPHHLHMNTRNWNSFGPAWVGRLPHMSLSVAVLTCKLGPARNGLGKGGTANSPRVLPTEIEKMAPVGYGGHLVKT
jgi:hypothetical protein